MNIAFFSRTHRPLARLLVFAVMAVTPAFASAIYELSGTLEWQTDSPADRLNLDGLALVMTFEITNPTPNNVPDPNGTQSVYAGLGTLRIGGVEIPIASGSVSFFHASSPMNDVANFSLQTVSGDPAFYYPAIQLLHGSNASAATQPPIYGAGNVLDGFLLVSGEDPEDPAGNSLYAIRSLSFSSFNTADPPEPNPVPEPGTCLMLGIGGAVMGARRLRRWLSWYCYSGKSRNTFNSKSVGGTRRETLYLASSCIG